MILLLFKGYEGYSDCLFKILKSNVSENKKFDTEGAILTIDKVKEFLNKHKEYIDKTKTHDIINIKKELFDKLKFY